MKLIKAPEQYLPNIGDVKVFLAGSIEMGAAVDWQKEVSQRLSNFDDRVVILNPRRDDWDASWIQSKDNEQFNTQVNWELNGVHGADIVFFYFAPGTMSPITLLELGTVLASPYLNSVIICCPDGYLRKGNVDITTEFFGFVVHENLESALEELEAVINRYGDF